MVRTIFIDAGGGVNERELSSANPEFYIPVVPPITWKEEEIDPTRSVVLAITFRLIGKLPNETLLYGQSTAGLIMWTLEQHFVGPRHYKHWVYVMTEQDRELDARVKGATGVTQWPGVRESKPPYLTLHQETKFQESGPYHHMYRRVSVGVCVKRVM